MSVPDREGSQLLPEDLGPGEPVSRLRPKKIKRKVLRAEVAEVQLICSPENFQVSDIFFTMVKM